MSWQIGNSRIELAQGDITLQEVDCVVNAANSRLAGGGGVDGAIHRRGGPSIMEETRRRYPNGCPTGSAVTTSAGSLSAKYVIHAVGPIWNGGNEGEADLLAATYRRSLELAVDHQCQSIALPAISAGAYGYPLKEAASIAVRTVAEFLRERQKPQLVRFLLFSESVLSVFRLVAEEQLRNP
jgi:O-acetyl-ADP-ribose deacetylase (regulator of RNase III)